MTNIKENEENGHQGVKILIKCLLASLYFSRIPYFSSKIN